MGFIRNSWKKFRAHGRWISTTVALLCFLLGIALGPEYFPYVTDEHVQSLVLAVLGIIWIGQITAVFVMLALHPRKRIEWATLSKSVAFALIVSRAFFTRFTGIIVAPWQDLIFWTLMGFLTGFFSLAVIIEWGRIAVLMVKRDRRNVMYIGGGLLALIIVIVLLLWLF